MLYNKKTNNVLPAHLDPSARQCFALCMGGCCGFNNRGFTLVEAIVTGILFAISGIVIITLFSMFTAQQREGLAMSRMQQQWEEFHSQLTKDMQSATWVNNANTSPVIPIAPDSTLTEIWVLKSSGNQRYRILGNAIRINEPVFFSSFGPLYIANGAMFALNNMRNELTLKNFKLRTIVKNDTFWLEPRAERFTCKNWKF